MFACVRHGGGHEPQFHCNETLNHLSDMKHVTRLFTNHFSSLFFFRVLSHTHTPLNRAYYLFGLMMMIAVVREKREKNWTNIDPCRCVSLTKKIRDGRIENLSLSFSLPRVCCLNIIFILCMLIQLRITHDHKKRE